MSLQSLDGSTDSTEDSNALTREEIFLVLANERRREILRLLFEHGGTLSVGDLAEWIASKENDTPVERLSSYDRKCVYIGLYQNHLPLMDDVGVVEYDDGRKTVELDETAEGIELYLQDPSPQRNRNRLLTSAAAVCSAILVLIGVLQVGIFASLSVSVWIGFGLVALLSLTILDVFQPAQGTQRVFQ